MLTFFRFIIIEVQQLMLNLKRYIDVLKIATSISSRVMQHIDSIQKIYPKPGTFIKVIWRRIPVLYRQINDCDRSVITDF